LPKDRQDYDRALRAAHEPTDQYGQGYLPYQIADGWQRIVRDLAYWRVDVVGATKAATADERAFFAFDRTVREAVTLRDIGYWGHFVADGSQPLHVSVHFNGWNQFDFKTKAPRTHYPNPNNFSNSTTIHARCETTLVRTVATEDLVAARVPAAAPSADPILAQVGAYHRDREPRARRVSSRSSRRDRHAERRGENARARPAGRRFRRDA